MLSIPQTLELGLDTETRVHFHCDGKKGDFFLVLLDLVAALMILLALATSAFILWLQLLRPVKGLLTRLQRDVEEDQEVVEGGDLVLLLDLVAHSQGLPLAVRLLSLTHPQFHSSCQPIKVRQDQVESQPLPAVHLAHTQSQGDSTVITWSPAPLHLWLSSHTFRGFSVTGYMAVQVLHGLVWLYTYIIVVW